MGGASSRPDIAGFRVLRIEPASPAAAASDAWVPYFDVLTHAGSADLTVDQSALTAQLKSHIGRPLELRVVNAKSLVARDVTVFPSNNWGGEGLLGLQVRFDAVDVPGAPSDEDGDEWGLHVVEVEPDSVGAAIGLVAIDDFILGSVDRAFADVDAFSEYVYARRGPMVLYVYRASTDAVRTLEVELADGDVLGISVANGVFHKLPNRDTDGISIDQGRTKASALAADSDATDDAFVAASDAAAPQHEWTQRGASSHVSELQGFVQQGASFSPPAPRRTHAGFEAAAPAAPQSSAPFLGSGGGLGASAQTLPPTSGRWPGDSGVTASGGSSSSSHSGAAASGAGSGGMATWQQQQVPARLPAALSARGGASSTPANSSGINVMMVPAATESAAPSSGAPSLPHLHIASRSHAHSHHGGLHAIPLGTASPFTPAVPRDAPAAAPISGRAPVSKPMSAYN